MRPVFVFIVLLLAGCAAQAPVPPKPVNLIVFPGGFNWPIWVAQEKGLFVKHGIGPLVGGARKAWADANREAVIGYIRAFSEAVDWLYEGKNKNEAVAILRKNLPAMNEQAGQTAYGVLLHPRDGFQRKARLDLEGVRTVLQLRSKYGEPRKALSDPARYYDDSFYQAAMR